MGLVRFTDRLSLERPVAADLDEIFRIVSDERVWRHYPSLRFTEFAQATAMLERWDASWNATGLGVWTVRLKDSGELIGHAGCTYNADLGIWNLGYRLSADHHGHGYATEAALEAVAAAQQTRPEVPVTAYLVAHNAASARVIEKVGLQEIERLPDVQTPEYTRVIYADRPLPENQRPRA